MAMPASPARSLEAGRGRDAPVVGVEPAAIAAAASLFRSLGDPSRLSILTHLMTGEHKVVELTDHLGLAQSTVSANLRCLLDCGMVEVRAQGRASVYSLAAEPALLALLSAAESLLEATGEAVTLCPTYGTRTRT